MTNPIGIPKNRQRIPLFYDLLTLQHWPILILHRKGYRVPALSKNNDITLCISKYIQHGKVQPIPINQATPASYHHTETTPGSTDSHNLMSTAWSGALSHVISRPPLSSDTALWSAICYKEFAVSETLFLSLSCTRSPGKCHSFPKPWMIMRK